MPIALSTVRAAHRRVARGGDRGFTLLEVVISFVVFTAVATTAGWGIVRALKASHASQQRVDAANVAQYWVNDARAQATKIIVTDPTTPQVLSSAFDNGTTVSQEKFTVQRWIVFSAPNTTACTPGTTFAVNVLVYRGDSTNTKDLLARSDSVVACPPA